MTTPDPAQVAATAPEQITPDPATPAVVVVEDPPGAEHLGDPGKKALDAMKAQLLESRTKLQEFEDRDKSELQRAQDAAARSAAELAEMRRQNVLLSKGIPVDLAPPSPTSTPEEWSAYADQLIAWRGQAVTPVVPASPPDPGQGITNPPQSESDALYAAFLAATSPNNRK